MTKTSDVRPGMRNLNLDLRVIEKEETHHFQTDKGEGRVATAICEDDAGEIKVSLWNEDVDRVEVGDRIKIRNGYSRLFKDEVHISAGKYGELEILSDSDKS